MRDPARIEGVLAAIRNAWYTNPDLRLTQLLFNAARLPGESASGFYNTEDDELVRLLIPQPRVEIAHVVHGSVTTHRPGHWPSGACGQCNS